MHPFRYVGVVIAAVSFLITGSTAWAQAYPSKPIRIVVAYAPGGSTDIAARLIADELMQAFGWRIVIVAVTGSRRSQATPEAPTIAESGLPGYERSAGKPCSRRPRRTRR